MARGTPQDEVRSFFAVEVGAEARAEAAALARRLRDAPGGHGVRWVRSESYHVTLRFLGSVAADALAPLGACVRDSTRGLAPFELHLAAVLTLPSLRHQRVVAVGLEPVEPLERLAAAVEEGVVRFGLEPEPRPFRAHLTLGRVRRGGIALPPDPPAPAPFAVDSFVLFRSELAPQGATYTPLERIALEGNSAPERSHSP